jgi:tellurite resistance protein
MPLATPNLIGKVAHELSRPPAYAQESLKQSILVAAAASYGAKSHDDLTQPTGFDPEAARLFEAIVESAFLVANADGTFDDTERQAFEHVVVAACAGRVGEVQIAALLQDLTELLEEDGADKRVAMVTKGIARSEHAREVVRVATLIAHVSGGVSPAERAFVGKLAASLNLDAKATEAALAEVTQALSQ